MLLSEHILHGPYRAFDTLFSYYILLTVVIFSIQKSHRVTAISNHTYSSPNRDIIVLAIVKLDEVEAEFSFYNCVYNYSLLGRECV